MATPSFQYIQPTDLTTIYSYTPPKTFTPDNINQAIAYACERINSLTGNQIENYGFDKLTPNQQALVKRATCRLTIGCLEGVALAWASGSISVSGGSLSFSQSTEAQFVDKVVIRDVFDLLQNAGLYQPRKYVENAYSPRDCQVDTFWDPLEPIEKYFRYIDWGTADARYVQLQRISSPDHSISITYNVLQQTLQLTAKGGGSGTITGILPTPNEITVDNTIPATPKIGLDNAIKTSIANNTTHIGDVVDKNTADIAALQATVNPIPAEITQIQSDISAIQGRLTTDEGNITTLQGQNGALNTRLTTAEGNINTIYNNLSQQLTIPDNFNLTLDDPKTLSSPDMSTIAGWVEDFGTNYTIEVFNTTNSATQYIDVEIGKILVNQHWYNDIVNVVYDASTHTFKLQSQNPLTVTAGTIKGIELIGASGSTSPWKQLEDQKAWTYNSTNKTWERMNWTALPNNAQYRIEANNENALYSILTSDNYLVNGGIGISKWNWQGGPLSGSGCWFQAIIGVSQSGVIIFVDKTETILDSSSARFTIYVKLGYL